MDHFSNPLRVVSYITFKFHIHKFSFSAITLFLDFFFLSVMVKVERSVQNGVYSAHAATCQVLDLYFLYIDPIFFRIKNSFSVMHFAWFRYWASVIQVRKEHSIYILKIGLNIRLSKSLSRKLNPISLQIISEGTCRNLSYLCNSWTISVVRITKTYMLW